MRVKSDFGETQITSDNIVCGSYVLEIGGFMVNYIYQYLKGAVPKHIFYEIILIDDCGAIIVDRPSDPSSSVCNTQNCLPELSIRPDILTIAKSEAKVVANEAVRVRNEVMSGTVIPILSQRQVVVAMVVILIQNRSFYLHTEILKYWAHLVSADYHSDGDVDKVLTSNEQMLRIMNTVRDGFLAINANGTITSFNNTGERICRLNAHKAVGQHIVDVFKFKPQILKVLETGHGWTNRDFNINLPYGGQVQLKKSATPIYNEKNEVAGVVDIFYPFGQTSCLGGNVSNSSLSMSNNRGLATFDDLVFCSSQMYLIVERARYAAQSINMILLQGESGTGKELFAQAIHNASPRCNGPFIVVDCGSLPRELIESELFGYAEGTFTGARRGGRPGKFELANGGTVFLDEIGEMPLELQTRLLRVLQNRTVTRLGSSKPIHLDMMIIAATNKDLKIEVANDRFRRDLYYRLNVGNITIPPLRERRKDIPCLVQYFIRRIGLQMGKHDIAIDQEALGAMMQYDWPGNVREMENILEQTIGLICGKVISLDQLSEEISNRDSNRPMVPKLEFSLLNTLKLMEIEKQAIVKALDLAQGNRTYAARLLGISRSTLYEKLKSHSISGV